MTGRDTDGALEAAGAEAVVAGFNAAARAAAAASFSRSISCFDLTKAPVGIDFGGEASPVPVSARAGVTDSVAVAVAAGAAGPRFAAYSSRKADALMLSTVLETDFTSWAMIRRSLRSAIISLLSKPSSSASL